MRSSFLSKVALMDAAYAACANTDPQTRTDLLEGIFWVADCLEEEIKKEKIPNLTQGIGEISEIKDVAEESFKDATAPLKLQAFKSFCYKLWGDAPELAD